MASRPARKGVTTAVLLAATVFAVVGVVLGHIMTSQGIADRCDSYGIMYAGTVAYDCKRREAR